GSVPQSEAMGEGTRLRALPDLSPRAKRWGKGPACGHYRICPPERSDGGRDPLAGTTGSVPQSEAMGEGTRLRALPDLSPRAKRWGKGPACGYYRICPPERSDGGRDPLAGTTGSVPQSEAMGEGTRLRVGGHQTRPRTPETPTPAYHLHYRHSVYRVPYRDGSGCPNNGTDGTGLRPIANGRTRQARRPSRLGSPSRLPRSCSSRRRLFGSGPRPRPGAGGAER